jgi:hypothetical protein
MPRSRTAWVANYLTTGGVYCEHELLSRFRNVQECAEWMRAEATARTAVGMSDSGAVLFQDALAEALPEARWVILRRPVAEVEESFRREHGLELPDLWAQKRKVDDAIMRRNPLVVDFPDVDGRIREVAEYCVPGWVHDEDRHRMLLGWDVQLTRKALATGIKEVCASGLLGAVEPPRFTPSMIRADELLREALASQPAAWRFWCQLSEAADIWDHTVDGDGRDLPKTDRVFKAMWLEWPTNGFLRQFAHVLVPVMSAAISAWQHGGRAKAADIYTETANAIIFLIHGQAGVDRWMPEIRALHATILAEDKMKDGD